MEIDWTLYNREMLSGIDLHTLLPQQEPFFMVDKLVAVSPTGAVTETIVQKSNIFVEEGRLQAPGLLENMAQTQAARLGFLNKYILHKDIQTGVIGAIKKAEFARLPAIGETLTTEVKIVGEAFGMLLSEVKSFTEKGLVATAEMKIAVKD